MLEEIITNLETFRYHQDPKKNIPSKLLTFGLKAWLKMHGDLPNLSDYYHRIHIPELLPPTYRLIDAGFHTELGLSANNYFLNEVSRRSSLPMTEEQEKRFPLPVVVEPRVLLEKQLELVKIKSNGQEILVQLAKAEVIASKPYLIRVRHPDWYRGKTPKEAVSSLERDERACTFAEVVAFYIQYPELFRRSTLYSGVPYKIQSNFPRHRANIQYVTGIGVGYSGEGPSLEKLPFDFSQDPKFFSDDQYTALSIMGTIREHPRIIKEWQEHYRLGGAVISCLIT